MDGRMRIKKGHLEGGGTPASTESLGRAATALTADKYNSE